MKKTYFKPSLTETAIRTQTMICTSGVSSSLGISYGGVDTDGSKTPNSRRSWTWDDENEGW